MAAAELYRLRVAAVRRYPAKEELAANHARLMEILGQLAPQHPEVVERLRADPEAFLRTRRPEAYRR